MSTHWSDDTELLERFVLNRLEPAKRQELEAHLRSCETCQHAVRTEQELVAGVRRLGRDELKARLKHRLASIRSEEIPVRPVKTIWTWQIASAAAVLLLLIGIGIYNRWFTFREEKQIEEQNQVGQAEGGRTGAEKDENKSAGPAERRSAEPMKKEPSAPMDRTVRSREGAPSPRGRERDKFADKKIAAGGNAPVAHAPEAGVTEQGEQPILDGGRIQSGESIGTKTLWVDGTLLKSLKIAAAKKADQFTKSQVESASEQPHKLIVQQDGNTQAITLHQQRNDVLPPSRKLRQKQLEGNKVQTFVERTDEGLDMTMYLDSLLDESELRNATVHPVNQDSLVVNFNEQRIGYHIPGGWTSQGTTKTKVK